MKENPANPTVVQPARSARRTVAAGLVVALLLAALTGQPLSLRADPCQDELSRTQQELSDLRRDVDQGTPRAEEGGGLLRGILGLLTSKIVPDFLTKIFSLKNLGQSWRDMVQTRVWSPSVINSALGAARNLAGQYRSLVQSILNRNIGAATLPRSRSLESVLRSGDVGSIGRIRGQLEGVFLPFPTRSPSDSPERQAKLRYIDALDSLTVATMADGINLDSVAERQIAVAQQMERFVASQSGGSEEDSAPGSAELLKAYGAVAHARQQLHLAIALSGVVQLDGARLAQRGMELKQNVQNRKDAMRTYQDAMRRARQSLTR